RVGRPGRRPGASVPGRQAHLHPVLAAPQGNRPDPGAGDDMSSAAHAAATRAATGGESAAPVPDRTLKLASLLLQYPTGALFADIDLVASTARSTTPRKVREHLVAFVDWLAASSPADVGRHYVQTFDLRRRCALYLTYYRY